MKILKIYGIDCIYNNCLDARSHKCFSCKNNTDPNKNHLSKYTPDMQYATPLENKKPLYKLGYIVKIFNKEHEIVKIDKDNNMVTLIEK